MLSRKFSKVRVDRDLVLSKGATLTATSSAGVETVIDMTELAALNNLSATELGFLDGVTAGTGAVSKALVLNSSGHVAMPDGGFFDFSNAALAALGTAQSSFAPIVDQLNPVTGADGTKGVALPAASAGRAIFVLNTNQTSTLPVAPVNGGNDQINALTAGTGVFTMGPARGAWFIPTSATQWYVTGDAAIVGTPTEQDLDGLTASVAELNYNDITTLGTLAASKTWTSDASLDTIMPTGGLLTVQSGAGITFNSGSTQIVDGAVTTTVAAAEHGAGAIGTGIAPKTYRWTDRGVIITQTKFDLEGLASVATANDVIGLAAGGAAYIGRNVVATNGIIFKVELTCLETPTGGDNDVNVVANSSAVLAYDDAGGTTYLSNSGDLLIGQTIQNLVPGLTANDYFYITAGTGDTAATYTAGQYLLTTYGHAVLS